MATGKVRYEKDLAGTNRLMNSPEMVAFLKRRAEAGVAFAIGISPDYLGDYRRSFTVETSTHSGPKGDRAEARIINNTDHAVYVEYGGQRTPARHILARTVDMLEAGE